MHVGFSLHDPSISKGPKYHLHGVRVSMFEFGVGHKHLDHSEDQARTMVYKRAGKGEQLLPPNLGE